MNTIALVTLYNPDRSVIYNIDRLAEQVDKVFLLDNSLENDNSNLFSHIENSVYYYFGKNLGLSGAFNRILKTNKLIQYSDFILFFDQDSCVSDNLVHTLINDFEFLEGHYKIGCLGPVYFDSIKQMYSGISKRYINVENNCFKVSEIITSSMITRYSILIDIDFWNEDIFLDYADFDLCWRLAKKKYEIFITQNAVLNHSLGAGFICTSFFMKRLCLTYSPPYREYYQTRESVKFLKKNYVPFNWKRNFIFNLTIRIFIFLFHLPNKTDRLKYFCKGFFDGLNKKNGCFI